MSEKRREDHWDEEDELQEYLQAKIAKMREDQQASGHGEDGRFFILKRTVAKSP